MKNKKNQIDLRDVQDVVDIIGGKWRGAILASLCDKEKRFNALKRDIGKITARSLSKELVFLETHQLIERILFDKSLNSVTYRMTKHGQTLLPLIIQIVGWAQKHRKVVMALV